MIHKIPTVVSGNDCAHILWKLQHLIVSVTSTAFNITTLISSTSNSFNNKSILISRKNETSAKQTPVIQEERTVFQ